MHPGEDIEVWSCICSYRFPPRVDDGCACNGLTLGKAEMYSNKVSPRQAELFAATRIANNQASMYGAVDLANEDIGSLLQRALP